MRTTTIGRSPAPSSPELSLEAFALSSNVRTDDIAGTGWHRPNECSCPSCSLAAHCGHPPVSLSHLNLLPPKRTCANDLAVFGCLNSDRSASGNAPEKEFPDNAYVVPAAKESRSCVSDFSASYIRVSCAPNEPRSLLWSRNTRRSRVIDGPVAGSSPASSLCDKSTVYSACMSVIHDGGIAPPMRFTDRSSVRNRARDA
mmetsp:Transcript_155/g.588  ORF Transcript_155/g.588 Transcript_155/m.588 type:complete len:200 (+) Transcript_155:2671-3270(+)